MWSLNVKYKLKLCSFYRYTHDVPITGARAAVLLWQEEDNIHTVRD